MFYNNNNALDSQNLKKNDRTKIIFLKDHTSYLVTRDYPKILTIILYYTQSIHIKNLT